MHSQARSSQAIRAQLAVRLRERTSEIERAIFARIRRLSEPVADENQTYVDGLRVAVAEAVNYGVEGIEQEGDWLLPIPPGTARQARLAAREGVRLDTVLRRYAAGNGLLEEFIVEEAEGIPGQVLRQILRDQASQVDRLMESVAAEYRDELERAKRSSAQRHAERVQRLLLDDGVVSIADFEYDFTAWSVGMILTGRNAEGSARAFAKRLGYRPLCVDRGHGTAWVWLGSTRKPVIAELERDLIDHMPAEISIALGEPRRGLQGWRLTHHEAQAALQVMLQRPKRITRGSDVVLLAGILRDDTLVKSLLDTYLGPLNERGDSGRVLRETLRAYFSAGGNAAAAAAGLEVTRHTVQRRIRTVERALGQLLHTCHAELQVALQLDELDRFGGGSETG